MPETNIGSADYSDVASQKDDYSVTSMTTDGISDQKETTWMNDNWTQQLGYYKQVAELRAAIDAKATWTVGKGYLADPETTFMLDFIKGFGKDTFNTILENLIRTYYIGGDAYAEIIRDKNGILINLKPLDTGSMRIVANRKGKIIRYEQVNKTETNNTKKFKPEEIFHLPRNRVADEIHGVSVIDAVEEIILMRNEAMTDWKRVLHRNIDPLFIFHLDTDDTAKIAAFKGKMDAARGKGENIYIPKGAVVPELVATATNASLNPLSWIEALNDYFYEAVGTPKIIMGNSKSFTDASSKIVYLAFQQNIEEEQLFIKEQVGMQLGLSIELEFPVRLEGGALSAKEKEGEMKAAEPNDLTAEVEGRT